MNVTLLCSRNCLVATTSQFRFLGVHGKLIILNIILFSLNRVNEWLRVNQYLLYFYLFDWSMALTENRPRTVNKLAFDFSLRKTIILQLTKLWVLYTCVQYILMCSHESAWAKPYLLKILTYFFALSFVQKRGSHVNERRIRATFGPLKNLSGSV